MKMITRSFLRSNFPGRTPRSFSGYIPMQFFVEHEKEIRQEMASYAPYRVWYRGPRRKQNSMNPIGATLRRDATHAVLYWI